MPDVALTPDTIGLAQQQALIRLLLAVTGETHRLLTECAATIRRKIESLADESGALPTTAILALQDTTEVAWAGFWKAWGVLFATARREAALLGFAQTAFIHGEVAGRALDEAPAPDVTGAVNAHVDSLIAAAEQRIYQDGLTLSQRLWQLNSAGLRGIGDTLYTAIADGKSAYETAQRLEQWLGAGADCPRWTQQRLRLSKAAIAAGDPAGLIRGNECASQGVAYAALRMARTEIQAVHIGAAEQSLAASPWVNGIRILLSGSHPKPDICDTHARGGPSGNGTYPKDRAPMPPFHPQCLCFIIGTLIPLDEAAERIRSVLNGHEDWPELGAYAGWLGVPTRDLPQVNLWPLIGAVLVAWLTGEGERLEPTS